MRIYPTHAVAIARDESPSCNGIDFEARGEAFWEHTQFHHMQHLTGSRFRARALCEVQHIYVRVNISSVSIGNIEAQAMTTLHVRKFTIF